MRIIVCNNSVRHGGGTDAFVATQSRALRRLGHDVQAFGPDNSLLDDTRGLVKARLLASSLYSLPAKRMLDRLLTADRYDLAYVHNTVPLLTGSIYDALSGHQIPTVQHLHNHRGYCLSSYAYRAGTHCDLCASSAFTACTLFRCYRGSYTASAALTAARFIDCSRGRVNGYGAGAYVANSVFTKEEHVRHGFPDERIWVLHPAGEDLAVSLGTPTLRPPHKTITYVGSLISEKGVYSVLDLAAHLPDWEVNFIGSGSEDARLRRQAAVRGLHNVRLAGRLSGLAKARAWRDSFMTLAPSLCLETFGLVVPESYSLSIPVLSTGLGGMAETIRDGDTGFIQSFRDAAEAAALIRALWTDKGRHEAMRRAARGLYDAEFSDQAFTQRLSTLQSSILDALTRQARHT